MPHINLTAKVYFWNFLYLLCMFGQIFDRIRDKWPERLEKIRPVEGDVSQADLGMSPADSKVLQDQVNIVIHSAATIRFIEPLSEALTLNTLGTKRLIELCHKIKGLKVLLHISPNNLYYLMKITISRLQFHSHHLPYFKKLTVVIYIRQVDFHHLFPGLLTSWLFFSKSTNSLTNYHDLFLR